MGCGASSTASSPADELSEKTSKSIDKLLREDEKRLAREVKMLLLGPGSSGKSTILKQMKVIHLKGFTSFETEAYRQQIFINLVDSMRSALQLLDESEIELEDGTAKEFTAFIDGPLAQFSSLRDNEPFPFGFYAPLKKLWEDSRVQKCVAEGSETTIPEYMEYFYTNLHRLFHTTPYVPSDLDVLRCRQKTIGISETKFQTRDLVYRLFDVGGQRSERKKWIHCFENVTAVLFLASLSGYDQPLLEDPDSNQMQEALMLFDSICNSQWFAQTSIILFLNKVDVFKERILVSSVKAVFEDYEGDDRDFVKAREYFKHRFTRLNRSQSKEIYANYTTAIDTNLIRVVMASVSDIIVARSLSEIIL